MLADLEFARLIYGQRPVVLDVAAFNERASRLYRRLGFTETGRGREHASVRKPGLRKRQHE